MTAANTSRILERILSGHTPVQVYRKDLKGFHIMVRKSRAVLLSIQDWLFFCSSSIDSINILL